MQMHDADARVPVPTVESRWMEAMTTEITQSEDLETLESKK
jgi:hypothetical protein